MGFIKRLLLFAAVGTVSIILAGCYGVGMQFRAQSETLPPSDSGNGHPLPDLETTSASPSR